MSKQSSQSNAKTLPIVFRSRKAGKEMEMDFHDLPEASQEAIIRYGAQRFINDKLGGSDLGTEEAGEKFDQILLQLREGWIDRRGQGGGSGPADPIEREMEKLARERIKTALRAKGIPQKDVSREKMAELIAGVLEKHGPELRPQAEAIVKAKSQTLDLGELDI